MKVDVRNPKSRISRTPVCSRKRQNRVRLPLSTRKVSEIGIVLSDSGRVTYLQCLGGFVKRHRQSGNPESAMLRLSRPTESVRATPAQSRRLAFCRSWGWGPNQAILLWNQQHRGFVRRAFRQTAPRRPLLFRFRNLRPSCEFFAMVIARLIAMALVLLLASCCFLCVHRSALVTIPPPPACECRVPQVLTIPSPLVESLAIPQSRESRVRGWVETMIITNCAGQDTGSWLLAPVPAPVVSLSHPHDRRL